MKKPRYKKLLKKLSKTNKVAILVVALVAVIGVTFIVLTRAATATLIVNDNTIGTGTNQWSYTGSGWAYYTDGGNKYNGDDHSSGAAGDYATLKFRGRKAAYYGPKAPQAGIVAISVDNGAETMVDLYSATRADNTLLYTTPTLAEGDHTLKIRLTGNKNPSATAAAAAVDRAIVTYDLGNATFASAEPEDGTLSSGAVAVTDSTASNGKGVKFANGTVPPPVPPVPPTPPGVLPAKLVNAYWQMYQGPHVSEITAMAKYDVQYASFANGSDTSGRVHFNPVFSSPSRLKTDIANSKLAGSKWLISLGGGGDHTIKLTTATHATNMYNSLVPIIDNYGFQGIDYDLECGSACFGADAAVLLAQKLKDRYGSNFIISAAPRPYEARGASTPYGAFAVKAGNLLDLWGLQFYDFPETRNAATLEGIINSDIQASVNMGVDDSKILIGCITWTGYQMGWNTVTVYKDIFLRQEAKHPQLRGVFIWESSLDKKENWSFSKIMNQYIK